MLSFSSASWPVLAVLVAALVAGCGTNTGNNGGYVPYNQLSDATQDAADTSQPQDVQAQDMPQQEIADEWSGWTPGADAGDPGLTDDAGTVDIEKPPEPSDWVKEAAAECATEMIPVETKVIQACQHSTAKTKVLSWAVAAASQQIQSDARLPGKDWKVVLGVSPYTSLGDEVLDAYTCGDSPLWVFDDPPVKDDNPALSMNAFAMPDAVWMLDPLMSAMAESAAWWDKLQEQHGVPLPQAGKEQLATGIMTVFIQAFTGTHWTVVPKAEVDQRLAVSLFAKDLYAGAVSFVLFHEIGHANLNHGILQCVVRKGIGNLLKRRGVEPSQEQMQQLNAELSQLTRNAEVQADIYGLTMLKSLGFGKQGPTVFAVGLLGVKVAGCQAKGVPESQLQSCAMTDFDYKTSHPPLAERMALIQKIFDEGQDLTGLLVPTSLGSARAKACGNGVCEPTESWLICEADCPVKCGDGTCQGSETASTCPADCGRTAPVCGDGKCTLPETSATCAKDCGPPPPVCGDGKCEAPETSATCSKDCGPVVKCGDMVCNGNETAQSCPDDCDAIAMCLNVKCAVEQQKCGGNLSCSALLECMSGCGDDACVDQCGAQSTTQGQQLYTAYYQCAVDQGCIEGDPAGGSCQGLCGKQSGACYCDDACVENGDCCEDYAALCAGGSCAGMCGGQSAGGCYCDAGCTQSGDCCVDKAYYCG